MREYQPLISFIVTEKLSISLPLFAVAGMDLQRSRHYEQFPPTWNRWLEVLRVLIKYGASTNEIVRGRSLAGLNIAQPHDTSQILPYLCLLAAEDALDLDPEVEGVRWPVLKNVLSAGTDAVAALDLVKASGLPLMNVLEDGRTALHLGAFYCSDDKAIACLLTSECGTYINRQDHWGWTPLHYAIMDPKSAEGQNPYSKAVRLLQYGADASIKGKMNPGSPYRMPVAEFTAFDLLEYVRYPRFELLTTALIDAGINIGRTHVVEDFYDAQEYPNSYIPA